MAAMVDGLPQGVLPFNNYLGNTLGMPNTVIQALNNQGLDTLLSLRSLNDTDVSEAAKAAKAPGGVIINPAWAPGLMGVPQFINNPGVTVGFIYIKRLRQLRYYLFHLRRVQRDFVPAEATLQRLDDLWPRSEAETKEEKKLELPDKLSSVDMVRKATEDLDDYLEKKRGKDGVLLAYVVRMTVDLPEVTVGEVDAGYGIPSLDDEMIRRARHEGDSFNADNAVVWDVIRHITHGGPGWNWVSSYANAKNGRSAYMALKSHYLGSDFQKRVKSQADKIMDSTFYDGKARNFTFEKYCERLNGAFTDMEQTGEPVVESRKVRIFLNGITDETLASAKSTVLATDHLNATFTAAVNFISQFVEIRGSHSKSTSMRQVSALNRGGSGGRDGGRDGGRGRGRGRGRFGGGQFSGGRYHGGRGRGGGGGGNRYNRQQRNYSDYMPRHQWDSLTPAQQQERRQRRAAEQQAREIASVAAMNAANAALYNAARNPPAPPAIQFQLPPPPANANTNTTQISALSTDDPTNAGDMMSQRRSNRRS